MGRAVSRAASTAGLDIVAAVGGSSHLGEDAMVLAGLSPSEVRVLTAPAGGVHVDVWIDFAPAVGLEMRAEYIAKSGAAWVCGSTGLSDAQLRVLDAAAAQTPVVWEPNFSVGIYVLSQLVQRAAAALGTAFDVEVVEAHHGAKRDAPSGTAKRLAEASGRAVVPLHALRGGDVIGDHSVHFMGFGERLELSHRATDRDLFARGAVRAALWTAGRGAGRYGLADVLGDVNAGVPG